MDTAVRIATKEIRGEKDLAYIDGFAAVYRVSVPCFRCDYVGIYEKRGYFAGDPFPKWRVIACGALADGKPVCIEPYWEILQEWKLGDEFDPGRFDQFMERLGYEVVGEGAA